MSVRTLEYEVGNLIFHWDLTSSEILIYEVETHWWLAKLAIMTSDGKMLPFKQKPFENYCDWFIEQGVPSRSPSAYDPWVCPETGSVDWCVKCKDSDVTTGHWPIRSSEYRSAHNRESS